MARNTKAELEAPGPVIEAFGQPYSTEINWTAEFRPVWLGEGQSMLDAFYALGVNGEVEFFSLEFSVAELPTEIDWLDNDLSDHESLDLNEPLDVDSVGPELEAIAILGESMSDTVPTATESDQSSAKGDLSELTHMSHDFLYPQVTIVIDTDTYVDSVAF